MPVIVPKPYDRMQREFTAEIARLASLAFTRYCRNPHEWLFLCGTRRTRLDSHTPSLTVWDSLTVASDAETAERADLVCVRPEVLPRHLTEEHLQSVIRDWLRREPLWIFAD